MGAFTANCFSIKDIHWENQPLFEISEDTICIWKAAIVPDTTLLNRLAAVLNPDEQVRANRYHHEKDRRRFIVSRVSLRLLLSSYLNTEPGDIEFMVGPNKKPYLKAPGARLHFNTSHIDKYVLIAIATTEAGIDIERTDTDFDWRQILHAMFSDEEVSRIEQSADPKQAFYLFWTRKEALAKATGKGLQDDLAVFPALDGMHNLNDDDFFSSWEVGSFKAGDNAIGAIAYQPSVKSCRFFEFSVEKLLV